MTDSPPWNRNWILPVLLRGACVYSFFVFILFGVQGTVTSSKPNYLPTSHLQMPSHWESGVQLMNLGGTQTFSPEHIVNDSIITLGTQASRHPVSILDFSRSFTIHLKWIVLASDFNIDWMCLLSCILAITTPVQVPGQWPCLSS